MVKEHSFHRLVPLVKYSPHVSAALIVAFLGLYLTSPTLHDPLLLVSWICLGLGFALAPKSSGGSKWEQVSIWALPGTAIAAIAGSYYWGSNETEQTAYLALLTLVLVPLYYVRHVDLICKWSIPLWLLHAVTVIYQGMFHLHINHVRAGGLAENQNAGAGFLVLGIIYLATQYSKIKWLALPLVAALPYTGSRWATVIAVGIVAIIFGLKYIPWRYLLVGSALTMVLMISTQNHQIGEAYRVSAAVAGHENAPLLVKGQLTASQNGNHIQERLALPEMPGWQYLVPSGFRNSHIHNVPLRMSVETSIASAVIWLGVIITTLWHRRKGTRHWWMLLATGLLSVMYYLTWVGPLGGWWWMLVAKEHDG